MVVLGFEKGEGGGKNNLKVFSTPTCPDKKLKQLSNSRGKAERRVNKLPHLPESNTYARQIGKPLGNTNLQAGLLSGNVTELP